MSKDRNTADVAFIKALAELLDANNLAEIEVERSYDENDSLCVRVSRQAAAPQPAPAAAPAPAPHVPAPPAASAPPAAAPAADAAPDSAADPADLPGAVTSPMVGTAYMAPEPGAEPFVKVGDQVNAGQTLMIIEAMKTMNHIPAPHAGTVKRVLVEDGTPVEYGAPLMVVE